MATNPTTNDQLILYTTLDIAPERYQTKTGTIISDGTYVVGTGTLFLSEIGGDGGSNRPTKIIGQNAWLFNGSTEIRRVVDVIDDTHLVIDVAFTVALAGAPVLFVPDSSWSSVGYLDATTDSSGGGKINNITLVGGEYNTFTTNDASNKPVRPLIVDGSTGDIHITRFASR